jgi:hypothetical protein
MWQECFQSEASSITLPNTVGFLLVLQIPPVSTLDQYKEVAFTQLLYLLKLGEQFKTDKAF